jgi:hypothetical protein
MQKAPLQRSGFGVPQWLSKLRKGRDAGPLTVLTDMEPPWPLSAGELQQLPCDLAAVGLPRPESPSLRLDRGLVEAGERTLYESVRLETHL